MRILMTCYEFPPIGGGAGKMAFGLARRLVASGVEVDVLTMGSSGLPKRQEIHGLSILRLPTDRVDHAACSLSEISQYTLRGMSGIRSLVQEGGYELLHSHFIFPDGLLAFHAAGATDLPYIITAHGTDVPGHNPHRVRRLHTLLSPLWKRVTSRAAAVVCPGRKLAERVASANERANIVVIPNALDANRFRPREIRRPCLLAVSRLVRLKGLQYLLDAIHRLGEDIEVVLVGDGPCSAELKQQAARLRLDVHFTGWLDNDSMQLKELYETAQIFVYPSESENCPVSLLEAMSAGLPIITTSDLGCQDVVGDAALIVPPRNSLAIAEAIRLLRGDETLRLQLGRSARRRVVENFAWHRHVERYRTLYSDHVR